ncbi:FAD-dependent monooxygenase [Azorhizobium doebereinerae]|uniref:FAD-dependent monooxygenase n=1 Tax=Azorhizobium doebereinerae TaxID=281091 RepID=UPI0003F6EBB1|nr:FAD-dependent monooxygenase [Azorhizobium doebereinerae]
MSQLPAATDILIIGAGPTGLALATALRTAGATPLLIDKQAAGANTSRAAVIHARTLEVLEPLGLVPALLAAGLKVPLFTVREGGRVLASVPFDHLATAFPFTLMCPQDVTEAILLDRLTALGGAVVRPAEAVAVWPGPKGVQVDVVRDGAKATVAARWLVGCDGMHSAARDAAGVPFEGATYPEDFILADVRMDWPLSREEVTLFFSPAGFIMVAPLPEDRFRIVATTETAPAQPDAAFVQAMMDARSLGAGACRITETVWSSRFRIHHRVAATPRAGRILLCGDAAHVHSPAGGQGMNTGIQDAVSLADPLLAAVRTGDEAPLDAWAAARHRVAEGVVSITDKMTRVAAVTSPAARHMRNVALTLVGHIPAAREAIARTLAELDNR